MQPEQEHHDPVADASRAGLERLMALRRPAPATALASAATAEAGTGFVCFGAG
jgi:hypothetical protein